MSKLSISPLGSLQPILPQNTGRYEKVQRQSTIIEPGMFLSCATYLPPQWVRYVHPEGNVYFHRNSGLGVVTESSMCDPFVAEQICAWAAVAEKQAIEKEFLLTNSVELFLELNGEDCNYYFVDQATKAVFWLEPVGTDELGLNDLTCTSHLRLLLEAQFWTHTENCCMHFGGLPQKDIDDLILVFSHAFADTHTSNSSTFPYDADACEKFRGLLTASRGRIHEGYTVCYVARLWSIVVNYRFESRYGHEQSRLDRDIPICVDEYHEPKRVQSLAYSFMTSTVDDWLITAANSAVLLFLQSASLFLPVSPPLFYASTSFAVLSIFTSSFLICKHKRLSNGGTTVCYSYLSAVCSPHIRFQGVAFVYALPKTFFLGGLLASCSQAVYILCRYVPPDFLLLSGAVLISAVPAAHYTASAMALMRSRAATHQKDGQAQVTKQTERSGHK